MKQNSGESILEEDFNIQELKLVVKSLKNTAPGKDNITNEIVRHFSESSLMILLNFYIFSWKLGILPDRCSPGNLSHFRANLETNCNSLYFSTVLFYEGLRMTF